MKKENQNRIKFYEFLNGDIDREALEKWVYANKELENLLPQDHYTDLIAYSFQSGDLKIYIAKLVKSFFDWQEYEWWRTVKLLKEIVEDKLEVVLATRKLRQLYLEQEESIKVPLITIALGIGFESALDDCPIETEYKNWNQESLQEKQEQVNLYSDDIKEAAASELRALLNKNRQPKR